MKNLLEKKLIISITLIITIGIATIVPLAFIMNNTAKAHLFIDDSWFNINVPCAYFNADVTYDVTYYSRPASRYFTYDLYYRSAAIIAIEPSINPVALDKATDARIEYFECVVYTNELTLSKQYFYLTMNSSNVAGSDALFSFANKYLENFNPDFSINPSGYGYGGMSVDDLEKPMPIWMAIDYQNFGQNKTLNKNYLNVLDVIENTPTIYLDITRIGYVSVINTGTVTIVKDNTLIQHLEMKNTGDGFMLGNPANVVDVIRYEDRFKLPPIS